MNISPQNKSLFLFKIQLIIYQNNKEILNNPLVPFVLMSARLMRYLNSAERGEGGEGRGGWFNHPCRHITWKHHCFHVSCKFTGTVSSRLVPCNCVYVAWSQCVNDKFTRIISSRLVPRNCVCIAWSLCVYGKSTYAVKPV